jgi:hypothetical protein
MHKGTYNKLAKFLKSNGYNVEEIYHPNEKYSDWFTPSYTEYYVTGKNITALFCTPNNAGTYPSTNAKIAADYAEDFNKWSQCPLIMDIEGIDHNKLLRELDMLGSLPDGMFHGGNPFTYQYEHGWYDYRVSSI